MRCCAPAPWRRLPAPAPNERGILEYCAASYVPRSSTFCSLSLSHPMYPRGLRPACLAAVDHGSASFGGRLCALLFCCVFFFRCGCFEQGYSASKSFPWASMQKQPIHKKKINVKASPALYPNRRPKIKKHNFAEQSVPSRRSFARFCLRVTSWNRNDGNNGTPRWSRSSAAWRR